ncbi:MAG TPA: metalloregulator ArsR/SmtB family transcription factor [Labilithrix sp.]|nr:metalloregulator ArsR/SmtB family transcription factor [Labilithrix sp.]
MTSPSDLEGRFTFSVAPRVEICFAAQAALDERSRIDAGWRAATVTALGRRWRNAQAELGGAAPLWAAVPDALQSQPLEATFPEMLAHWRALPLVAMQRTLIEGLIHDAALTERLVERALSPKVALSKVRKTKREWLAYVGLFPFEPSAPMGLALTALIERPAAVRDAVADALEAFWKDAFAATWERLVPAMTESASAMRRLFIATGFETFAREALLRIDVDEQAGIIRAARGGYQLRYADVNRACALPSAFNDKRFWSAYETAAGTLVYFPYFDPSLDLGHSSAPLAAALREPELDAALVFKVLGDTTRFALAMILAQEPSSAAELARRLDVSKPTITHHLPAFRQAGLVRETDGRLALRRDVIERLSAAAVEQLFHSNIPRRPKTTRSKP